MSMNNFFERLGLWGLIAGISGLLLIVALFAPWYSWSLSGSNGNVTVTATVTSSNGTALPSQDLVTPWQAMPVVAGVVLIASLAALGISLIKGATQLTLPAWERIAGIFLGGLCAVLILIGIISPESLFWPPAGGTLGMWESLGPVFITATFWQWLSLVLSIGIIVGSVFQKKPEPTADK